MSNNDNITGEPEFQEPKQKIQALMRVLRAALPATTHAEIAQNMTALVKTREGAKKLDAERFVYSTFLDCDMSYLLKHIRNPENSKFYGWTVPHAKRGAPVILHDYNKMKFPKKDRGRFFAVPINKKTGELILLDDENASVITSRAKQGLQSTLQVIATMGKNEAYAIEVLSRFDVVKRRKDLDLIVKGLRFISEISEEYIKSCEKIEDIWDVAV